MTQVVQVDLQMLSHKEQASNSLIQRAANTANGTTKLTINWLQITKGLRGSRLFTKEMTLNRNRRLAKTHNRLSTKNDMETLSAAMMKAYITVCLTRPKQNKRPRWESQESQ